MILETNGLAVQVRGNIMRVGYYEKMIMLWDWNAEKYL